MFISMQTKYNVTFIYIDSIDFHVMEEIPPMKSGGS